MKKVIYSIKEIEKKALETYQDRQIKKDWLSKHMELISSKTVLKDLRLGETYLEEANAVKETYEKIRLYQQGLAHYFLAYFRSHGKDRKAERELENAKEEYCSHLFNYFLSVVDDFESFESDMDFIKELAEVLNKEEKLGNTKEPLEKFYYNLDAFNLYKSVINLELEDINHIRNRFKEFKEKENKVVKVITKNLEIQFNENIQYLEKTTGNSNLLIKVDRTKLQKSLKYVKYFNLKLYNKYKNIVANFYTLRAVRIYLENEFTYEDYEGLIRNYKLFEKLPKLEFENKLIEDNKKYLFMLIKDYNKAFVEHNFEKIFHEDAEFQSDSLFLAEKFLRNLESADHEVLKELGHLSILEKEVDKAVKIEEILLLLKRSNLTFADFLNKKLETRYSNIRENIENIEKYKFIILDKRTNEKVTLLKKDRIDIGRTEENDIVILNKYISRKHMSIDLINNELVNGAKENKANMTYYNNKAEVFDRLNISIDRIKEINLGNLFTYDIKETEEENILMAPLAEKTNKKYLSEGEMSEFEKKSYLLVKNQGLIPIEMNNEDELVVIDDKGLQVKRGNKMARTIKFGLNYFDNRYEYILERI